jgi:hypothetical protein
MYFEMKGCCHRVESPHQAGTLVVDVEAGESKAKKHVATSCLWRWCLMDSTVFQVLHRLTRLARPFMVAFRYALNLAVFGVQSDKVDKERPKVGGFGLLQC